VKGMLILADGTIFQGTAIAAQGTIFGEVVFNTGIVGYESLISDPASKGQIMVMTYPLIGNYGLNESDTESKTCHLAGLILKESSRIYSNWRAQTSLASYLQTHGIVALAGIDTRALTVHLREHGEMPGAITTENRDVNQIIAEIRQKPGIETQDLVYTLTCREIEKWAPPTSREKIYTSRVAVIDLGVGRSLLAQLDVAGLQPILVPAVATPAQIMDLDPDGIIIAGGPGDATPIPYVVQTVAHLLGTRPILGINLGHLVLGLALGGRTLKMKVGHHGANQAVKQAATGKVEITCQHHSFVLDPSSLAPESVTVTWTNLVDQTVEGIQSTH
jgi:carbamoyl-phosphate synthase small subunit